MSFQNMCLCFLSHLQRSGYTALIDTVVVVGFYPTTNMPVLLMLQCCDNDMKTFSHLFNVRITNDVELVRTIRNECLIRCSLNDRLSFLILNSYLVSMVEITNVFVGASCAFS